MTRIRADKNDGRQFAHPRSSAVPVFFCVAAFPGGYCLDLRISVGMPPQFTYTRRVQFSDTDMAGIVHFANFYRFMEEAEHEMFRSLGFKIVEKQPDGSVLGWPRVQASCR